MGIPGACANYFFDELGSVLILAPDGLTACADGQHIGAVAAQLAHADAGDAGQLVLVLRVGLGDGHQCLVGEDAEGRLPAAARLLGAPLPQPFVETLVHVGGALLAPQQLQLATVRERAAADPAAGGAALPAHPPRQRTGGPGTRRRARYAALHASGTARARPARAAARPRTQSVQETAGPPVRAAPGGPGQRPGQVETLAGSGDADVEQPALLLDLLVGACVGDRHHALGHTD